MFKILWSIRKMSLRELPDGLVEIKTPLDTLVMNRDRAGTTLYEWEMWLKYYIMKGLDFKGKTVLDVGAGEGETVALYRLFGATKFICTDFDPRRVERLRANAERNHWDIEIYPESFTPKFLEKKFDFMKMDCEGCEAVLLDTQISFPCVIETHGAALTEAFQKKEGFSLIKANKHNNSALMWKFK